MVFSTYLARKIVLYKFVNLYEPTIYDKWQIKIV